MSLDDAKYKLGKRIINLLEVAIDEKFDDMEEYLIRDGYKGIYMPSVMESADKHAIYFGFSKSNIEIYIDEIDVFEVRIGHLFKDDIYVCHVSTSDADTFDFAELVNETRDYINQLRA